ncbi:MAG: AIG2-like family protein [Gemmatimonadetes bacterium]|nr:AIG2-like family protein [Gemmatimonadota bacterium]
MRRPALLDLVAHANAARRRGLHDSAAELELERHFAPAEHLAVYGTLAPGEINHHVVSHIGGTWSSGYVSGKFSQNGWGAAHGFPGMQWIPDADSVRIQLLSASALPQHWPALDEFEGPDYLRILVPVTESAGSSDGMVILANLYELR